MFSTNTQILQSEDSVLNSKLLILFAYYNGNTFMMCLQKEKNGLEFIIYIQVYANIGNNLINTFQTNSISLASKCFQISKIRLHLFIILGGKHSLKCFVLTAMEASKQKIAHFLFPVLFNILGLSLRATISLWDMFSNFFL